MSKVAEVNAFINEYILHTDAWDTAEDNIKLKAVNHAERTLLRLFPKAYSKGVPIEHIAEQSVWMLKIDEMVQKAEMGVTSFSIDGITVAVSSKDNSLCPFILEYHNLSQGWNVRRKRARYSTSIMDSNRKGWC